MLQALLLSVSIEKVCELVKRVNQSFCSAGTPTKTIDLGTTEIPEEIFMELLQDIAPHWNASTYDLFNHNCNNFTNEVANLVMGHGIPEDIVGLPQEFLATPLGQSLAPMLTGMQQNMMQSSNQLFNTNDSPAAGQGAMPGMGGMGGMGGMPPMGGGMPPMGMPPMGGAQPQATASQPAGGMGGMGAGGGMPPMGGGMPPMGGGGGAGGDPLANIPPGMIPPGMEGMARQMM